MKRFFAVLAVSAFVVAVPLSHLGTAAPNTDHKVDICHFPDASPVGFVISIDEHAVEAHEAHGDCVDFGPAVPGVDDGSCVCSTTGT